MNDLERVTARAVECGIYGANKTLLNAAPRFLLAFEQATLKEANETIEQLTAKLAMLSAKAESVVARWDTPLWKDAPATAIFINELRNELK